MSMVDRNGNPLKVGQHVRVQTCVGRYGQTEIRKGAIVKIGPGCGLTIKTDIAFTEDCGRFGMQYRPADSDVYVTVPPRGYEKFNDFEHGHEKWVEITA